MEYLLDTHAFIWSILDTKEFTSLAKSIIQANANKIHVSTISFWEISLKTSIKKYSFKGLRMDKLEDYAKELGFTVITLASKEAETFYQLAAHAKHKDPFDRMIIWQAIRRRMPLVSKDSAFEFYSKHGLTLVW